MKRLLLSLSLLATIFFMASCTGGGGTAGMVGSWGLSYFEWQEYLDGELYDEDSYEYNPTNPSSDDDMKLEISHVDGNDYLFKSYEWSPRNNDWKQIASFTMTIEGGKATYDGETITFKTSGNTLTITTEETDIDEDGSWVYRTKNVYKRLSGGDNETETPATPLF